MTTFWPKRTLMETMPTLSEPFRNSQTILSQLLRFSSLELLGDDISDGILGYISKYLSRHHCKESKTYREL